MKILQELLALAEGVDDALDAWLAAAKKAGFKTKASTGFDADELLNALAQDLGFFDAATFLADNPPLSIDSSPADVFAWVRKQGDRPSIAAALQRGARAMAN